MTTHYDHSWGSKLIRKIEAELAVEYLGGAIRWTDQTYANAWTKALDEFDSKLTEALSTNNFILGQTAGDKYLATVIPYLQEYKRVKQIGDAGSFLESLGGKK